MNEILELYRPEFVRLTGKYSNKPMFLRGSEIVCILPIESVVGFKEGEPGSAINLRNPKDHGTIYVSENPEEVMNLMKGVGDGLD